MKVGVIIFMHINIHGYIVLNKNKYTFTYNDELLQLVPVGDTENKRDNIFLNPIIEEKFARGKTSSGSNIIFINCKFIKSNYTGYIAKPAGYMYFDNEEFDTITFKGKAIDYFYRPNQKVGKDSKYCYETGSGFLYLESFKETTKTQRIRIDGLNVKMSLSILLPEFPELMTENYTLGNPHSILRLEFEDTFSYNKFLTVYSWIENLFKFVNYREDIIFDEIILSNHIEEKVNPVGYVYISNGYKKMDIDYEKTMEYYFFEEHIDDVLNIINGKKLNLLFIPSNERESRWVDPHKYLACCSSFESVFNYVYPNVREKTNQEFNDVKTDLLEFIKEKVYIYKGNNSRMRKEYEKIEHLILLSDFSLEEKFRYCLQKFDDILNEYISSKMKENKMEQIKVMPSEVAKLRNMLTHNSVEVFVPVHIHGYVLMQWMIYIMILRKSNISEEMIKKGIGRLLLY